MGHLITSKKVNISKRNTTTAKKIVHKAKILTASDVHKNRSSAYKFLAL